MKPLTRAGLVVLLAGLLGFLSIGLHRHHIKTESDAGRPRFSLEATDVQRIEDLAPIFICTVAVVAGCGMMLLAQRER